MRDRSLSLLAAVAAVVASAPSCLPGAPRLATPARGPRRSAAENEARLAAAAAKRARRAARHQGRA